MNACKFLFKVIKSPLGIALTFTHWIVVLFAFLGDNPEPGFGNSTYLLQYLVFLNFPSLIVTNLIAKLIMFILNINLWKDSIYTVVAIFSITLQWVLVGKFIESLMENTREESVNILK